MSERYKGVCLDKRASAAIKDRKAPGEAIVTTYLFMRIELPSGGKLGPSRTAILEGIDRFGSMSGAARAMGITYREVWKTVKEMNRMFGEQPLVVIGPGGRTGGAQVTPLGRKVAQRFREMEATANKALARQFLAFERLVGEDTSLPAPIPQWSHINHPVAPQRERKTRR